MSTKTVTKEMLDAAKEEHGTNVKAFEISDSDGNSFGDVMMKRPSATVIEQFERFMDKNSMKSRQILINGCLINRKDEIKDWDKNSEEYAAVFDAAAQMLPVGKASAKKL